MLDPAISLLMLTGSGKLSWGRGPKGHPAYLKPEQRERTHSRGQHPRPEGLAAGSVCCCRLPEECDNMETSSSEAEVRA